MLPAGLPTARSSRNVSQLLLKTDSQLQAATPYECSHDQLMTTHCSYSQKTYPLASSAVSFYKPTYTMIGSPIGVTVGKHGSSERKHSV